MASSEFDWTADSRDRTKTPRWLALNPCGSNDSWARWQEDEPGIYRYVGRRPSDAHEVAERPDNVHTEGEADTLKRKLLRAVPKR